MAKSRFLKPVKQVKKEIGKTFLNSAVSGGGFLGAKILTNKFGPKITNEKLRRVLGPAKYLIGTVLEAFSAQPQMAALGRGIAVSGMDTSATDFIPADIQAKLSLNTPAITTDPLLGLDVNGGKGFDWEKAAAEAERLATAGGNENRVENQNIAADSNNVYQMAANAM